MTDAVGGLPDEVAEGAQSSIAFTQSEQVLQLGPTAHELVSTAQQAFVDGVSGSLLIAAGIVAVTAVVVARLAPKPTPSGHAAETPVDDAAEVEAVPVT
jgi:hypothetical protein